MSRETVGGLLYSLAGLEGEGGGGRRVGIGVILWPPPLLG